MEGIITPRKSSPLMISRVLKQLSDIDSLFQTTFLPIAIGVTRISDNAPILRDPAKNAFNQTTVSNLFMHYYFLMQTRFQIGKISIAIWNRI
jgi:hypothetical protein